MEYRFHYPHPVDNRIEMIRDFRRAFGGRTRYDGTFEYFMSLRDAKNYCDRLSSGESIVVELGEDEEQETKIFKLREMGMVFEGETLPPNPKYTNRRVFIQPPHTIEDQRLKTVKDIRAVMDIGLKEAMDLAKSIKPPRYRSEKIAINGLQYHGFLARGWKVHGWIEDHFGEELFAL